MTDPIVFSISSYDSLADSICRIGGFERGNFEVRRFPDGEVYHRLESKVAGRHVALLGGTTTDSDTLEIYDLACGMVKYGAQSLTLAMPYFGYSTMERATRPGEVVKAKTRARLFSAIPQADSGNRMFLLDLHAEGIPHYFEGGIRPVHLYAKNLIEEAARRVAGSSFVIASTDAGRAKWVEAFANDLDIPAALVIKRRLDARRTEIVAVSAEVKGRNVVIYDDMIRTGGSLIEAARAYKAAGAGRIWALATHGVLPQGAIEKLERSELFEGAIVTDSHPNAVALGLTSKFLEVISVASLFAEAIGGTEKPTAIGGPL